MRRFLLFSTLVLTSSFLFSCGDGGGSLIANTAKLQSETLSRRVGPCTASATSCTPTNMGGRIYSGNVMLGEGGSQGGSYGMTWLGATDAVLEDPSQGKGGTLEFDLSEQTTFSGKISIPGEADMPTPPVIDRVELNFDYVDTSFTLTGTSGGAADGAYVVRTVFVDEATVEGITDTLIRGDKLVKAPGETVFKWCNTTTCSTTRATVATGLITDSTLVDYEAPSEGNPAYPGYVIGLTESLTVTYAQISSTTNVWTLDFNLTNAIQFTAAPSTFATERAVLSNFKLKFDPESTSADDRIRATLAIEAPTT